MTPAEEAGGATARPATVGELLEEAQRLVWDLPVTLPPARSIVRFRTATREVRGHLGAWPGVAAAAAHCLANLPLTDEDRDATAPLVSALERVRPTPRSAEMDPDPRMTRLAALLGAAGDLLATATSRPVSTQDPAADPPPDTESDRVFDPVFDPVVQAEARRDSQATAAKIVSLLRSAAVTTVSYMEVAPGTARPGGRWHTRLSRVVDRAHQLAQVPPSERSSRFDDLAATPIHAPGRATPGVIRGVTAHTRPRDPQDGQEVETTDLLTTFAAWQTAAHRALGESYPRSADMVNTALTLRLLLATTVPVLDAAAAPENADLVDPAVAALTRASVIESSVAWRDVPRTMRIATTGGGVDLDLVTAALALRGQLEAHLLGPQDLGHPHEPRHTRLEEPVDLRRTTHQPPDKPPDRLPALLADVRLLLRGSAETATVLRDSVEATARRQDFYLPARLATAAAPRPIPMEWVSAGRRRGWVRAPAALPQILDIRDSVDQAHHLTRAAALTGALTARLHQSGAGAAGHSAGYGRTPQPYRATLHPSQRSAGISSPRDASPPAF